jgi:hypothetical protein
LPFAILLEGFKYATNPGPARNWLTLAKGNLMAEPEVEAAWRAEFRRTSEKQFRDAPNSGVGDALDSGVGIVDEPKRQAGFRWLGDEAEEQRLREEKTYHYVRWTLFAAVAAVIVGLIGVGLSFLH